VHRVFQGAVPDVAYMPPLEPCSPGWRGGGGGWRPQAARLQVSFGVLQAPTPRPGSISRGQGDSGTLKVLLKYDLSNST
jgi:hypothetical protein